MMKIKENKEEILVWYWGNGREILNFGEHLVEILIEEFGYKPRIYSDAKNNGDLKNYESCLVVVGSELNKGLVDRIETPKLLVWGQGKGHGEYFDINDPHYAKKVDIRAVRGPHTIRQLNLNPDIPLGDPGFLLPLLFPMEKNKSLCKIIYMPHHSNRNNINDKLRNLGAEKYIDIMFKKEEFWNKLKELISAKFVLTSSLHTAIVAHAYNVPWALCLVNGESLNFPDKWRDLFEYLGIYNNFKIVKNYKEGLDWWKKVGSKAKIPSLTPLINSFPYQVRNSKIKEISHK